MIGGIALALTGDPQSTRAWERGSIGEQKLAAALAGLEDLIVLHDRRVPGTRGNIDHILIAPAGVFVVDAKHYAGLIQIRDRGGLFNRDERLYVGSRDCSDLATSMSWQTSAVREALASADIRRFAGTSHSVSRVTKIAPAAAIRSSAWLRSDRAVALVSAAHSLH